MKKDILKKQNKTQLTKPKGKGIYIFWSVVLVVYFLAFIFSPNLALNSLKETGQVFWKIIPIFFLILGVMVLVNLFFTPERVKKHLGKDAGLKGWFYAMIFGILVSGPPYALYPMLKEMKKHGLRTSYLSAFLYNRNVKIPLIPAMIYYFGWTYMLVMTVLVIIFSIISGLIMEKIVGEK